MRDIVNRAPDSLRAERPAGDGQECVTLVDAASGVIVADADSLDAEGNLAGAGWLASDVAVDCREVR